MPYKFEITKEEYTFINTLSLTLTYKDLFLLLLMKKRLVECKVHLQELPLKANSLPPECENEQRLIANFMSTCSAQFEINICNDNNKMHRS